MRANWDNIRNDLKHVHDTLLDMREKNQTVETMWKYFQDTLENSMKRNIPTKTARKRTAVPGLHQISGNQYASEIDGTNA